MDQKQEHKHRRKSSLSQKRELSRFLTFYLFIVLGVVFLLIGLYFSLSSTESLNNLFAMLMNFLKPADGPIVEEVLPPVQSSMNILLHNLSAALILIVLNIYAKKFPSITYSGSLIIALYLIVINTKILEGNFIYGVLIHSSFLIASLYLFLTLSLLFITAILHRKSGILILACFYFYFYISVVLYTATFSSFFNFLQPFVLFFTIVIFYVGRKIERPYINLINFSFGCGFFGLIFLAKFVVNSKPDFLIGFFTFTMLYYLLFYVIAGYNSSINEQPLRKWMQLLLTWLNLLFLLGTISFVLKKYYAFDYIWIFVLTLFFLNLLGIKLLKKFNSSAWTLPQNFANIFLAALVLPLMLHQNIILLFCAEFFVFMLVFTKEYKSKVAMRISLVAIVVMVSIYLFFWINYYLPALFEEDILPEMSLMWHGIVSNTVMVFALLIAIWFLEEIDISVSKKWFSNNKYNRLIRILLLISLFLTLGWIVFSLVCLFTGTLIYSSIGCFVSGSLFFIVMIYYYANKKSLFKKPLLYFAFTFTLLYPILVHWSMTFFLKNLVKIENLNLAGFILHYLALFLLIILGITTFLPIYWKNSGKVIVQHGIQLLTIVYLLFLLCTEYDILSVLLTTIQNSSKNSHGIGIADELLTYNQHIPYSVLMMLLTVFVFIYSIYKHNSFFRYISIILSIGILVKVFAYDFETLSQGESSVVFFVLGLLLIGFAFLYSYFAKGRIDITQTNT
ncbi:MAG: DUF2339 domain-containing protein [Bacteroidia bacterium]|nr:DUF2339 domain-containing protein [Bacteroidia bacterium]